MEKVRGFEIAKGFEGKGINLPERKTKNSAAYDIEAAEDVVIPSFKKGMKPTLVATGLKAYMQDDEYLGIHIRSSLAFKKNLNLVNSQGVIDADYYNNEDNEGHIMIGLINFGDEDVEITKGMRIAQAIFYKFLTIDDEKNVDTIRSGGFGSTGE